MRDIKQFLDSLRKWKDYAPLQSETFVETRKDIEGAADAVERLLEALLPPPREKRDPGTDPTVGETIARLNALDRKMAAEGLYVSSTTAWLAAKRLRENAQWQDIADAGKPAGGAPILACRLDVIPLSGGHKKATYATLPEATAWDDSDGRWIAVGRPDDAWEPTHWMPMPGAEVMIPEFDGMIALD